jgi:uncharacterized membrane protein (UPF0127 family)
VQIVHEPERSATVLATDVDVADTMLSQMKGLMGRSSVPDSYALVFDFGASGQRTVHMLFVRTALDVVWIVDEQVERVSTLAPWTGLGRARADTLIEVPPGAAEEVTVGDRVCLVSDDG